MLYAKENSTNTRSISMIANRLFKILYIQENRSIVEKTRHVIETPSESLKKLQNSLTMPYSLIAGT